MGLGKICGFLRVSVEGRRPSKWLPSWPWNVTLLVCLNWNLLKFCCIFTLSSLNLLKEQWACSENWCVLEVGRSEFEFLCQDLFFSVNGFCMEEPWTSISSPVNWGLKPHTSCFCYVSKSDLPQGQTILKILSLFTCILPSRPIIITIT